MRREPDRQQLEARAEFIDGYFEIINGEMARQGMRRNVLAEKMGCAPANITQILKQTTNVTAASMVDLAYHLGVKLKLDFISAFKEPKKPGTKVVVEKDVFNEDGPKRQVPQWESKKDENNFFMIGA